MPSVFLKLRPALLASVVTHLFYFSAFLSLLTPLPLFYLALKIPDRKIWRLACLLAVFFGLTLYFWLIPVDPARASAVRFFGLFGLFFHLLCAFFLSLGFWKGWTWTAWGLRAGLGSSALLLAAGFLLQGSGLTDGIGFLKAALASAREAVELSLHQPGVSEEVVFRLQAWLDFLPKLLPAFLFIFSLTVMAFNIGVIKIFRKDRLKYLGKFRKIQIPHGAVWVLIGAGLVFFLNEYLLDLAGLKAAALNALLAVLFVYFGQGLGILAHFTRRFSPLFRFVIYGLVALFLQFSGLLLAGVGVADTWVDFRKLGGKHGHPA